MRPHYVSRWLLREFTSPDHRGSEALYEMAIATKYYERRNVGTAGSEEDFWKQETEDGMLELDTKACNIFRNAIRGKATIALSLEDRVTFARWICLSLVRVPFARGLAAEAIAKLHSLDDLAYFREIVWASADECVESYKAEYPEMFARIVADQGEFLGREEILSRIIIMLMADTKRGLPDPKTAHENHLGIVDSEYRVLVAYLVKCKWTWLHVAEAMRTEPLNRFIICDNPVVRWNANGPNQLIEPGAQVTIPLGNFLTLSIGWGDAPESEDCSAAMTQQLNDRQLRSATDYIYSGETELLDRMAETF